MKESIKESILRGVLDTYIYCMGFVMGMYMFERFYPTWYAYLPVILIAIIGFAWIEYSTFYREN